jgi:hypothetical protein
MAIDTIDKLIKGLGESEKLRFYKPTLASKVAGEMHSLWYINGYPNRGDIPTAAEYCTKTLNGTWNLPTITGTNKMYLAKVSGSSSVVGQLIIFDRLSHMGGLSGIDVDPQTVDLNIVSAAAAKRCESDGTGILWCVEHYIDTGATARTLTVTYTNQDDIDSRTTTVSLKATCRSGFINIILPNVNDLRIKSIQSVQLNGTTGVVGNFGITARKRIAEIPIPIIGVGGVADYADLALPELTGVECLELLYVCGSTSTGNILGSMELIQG